MTPIIGQIWYNIQYPDCKVRILRLTRGLRDTSNLRVIYEYLDIPNLVQDTAEHFTDNFELEK